MKKTDRISDFVKELAPSDGSEDSLFDARYLGYFVCFNRGEYYEAHDVLEDLWLKTTGPDYGFYKGLIQIAGAFVHLRKQFERPQHHKDGKRMRPATRLFDLGMKNIAPFSPIRYRLNVEELIRFCAKNRDAICESDFQSNPWNPAFLPQLHLEQP
ncbi:MAG TPA: DUF309 domain-containing protein [Chthoniobacterales bacterium]